ncbi:para-aminobenzoate synthetase component 1 [Scopulibacillus darangshiensis]|uniref:Para-aminobenzoate synthetase component 1 n=1 Tax=Scopulibacillus darangshiensis TaxID=442528 RepID=A0A4R2N9W1_9BACL|nr:anthranilate synthase component I family protein [Scopulibacillus darangshiensis]TCP17762.1 para-aminobenzoate synthetase component 1 [Scopulibacillus darangshiensis]
MTIQLTEYINVAYKYKESHFFDLYERLASRHTHSILLESGLRGDMSVIGFCPYAILKGKDHVLTIETKHSIEKKEGPLLESIKSWMKENGEYRESPPHPISQSVMGYLSYDLARDIEHLPNLATDDLDLPDIYLLAFQAVLVFDKKTSMLHVYIHDVDHEPVNALFEKIDEEILKDTDILDRASGDLPQAETLFATVSMDEEGFVRAAELAKEYIKAGDTFQINLSVRGQQPLLSEPISIYKKLRELNPSPYMGYLSFPECQIISGSPEQLIKKEGHLLSTRPIAGTRSRGKDHAEEAHLAGELLSSVKERAEHLMLVDLLRNDLGRVSRYGTVEVDELLTIEKYSHVMHLVSNVRGILDVEKDMFDVIRGIFPGGTITGAPKIRTMEIIEELEPVRRGLYTGSVGWMSSSGDMEWNIAIRTMIAKSQVAYVQAGAGIVYDSNPRHEYKECLKKAAALWRAKQLSEFLDEQRGES